MHREQQQKPLYTMFVARVPEVISAMTWREKIKLTWLGRNNQPIRLGIYVKSGTVRDSGLSVSIQLLQLNISHPHPKQRLKTSGKMWLNGL